MKGIESTKDVVMSIDQSLSCSGIHIWEGGEHKDLYVIKTPPKGEVILRIREIVAQLRVLISKRSVTTVVIESLPYGLNSSSVRPLAALYYMINNMCIDLGVLFRESNVTAVKKFATMSGKANKKDMIQALLIKAPDVYAEASTRGYKQTTGLADIADGYFIGLLYIHKVNEEAKITSRNKEVNEDIR